MTRFLPLVILLMVLQAPACAQESPSVFYPARAVADARKNLKSQPWGPTLSKQVLETARPFMASSDEELWNLMFGATITRSWMVLSNGNCPACKKSVPMYSWEIDGVARPWKVRCPHCRELFPKNDFYKYYRSGLDEQGVFQPSRADRTLLFNAEHPDPGDPLRNFGVDDGEGYVEGDQRWRFIGAYLIYGQWKQRVLGGIKALSAAYLLTGDAACAHKAGVLLDRVADLYPTFDYKTQGLVYEVPSGDGYVSIWHDACPETRDLILAYDQLRPALARDRQLAAFLQQQADRHHVAARKATPRDVMSNIESRILRDCMTERKKIESNYPQTEVTLILDEAVLGWPGNKASVMGKVDALIRKAGAVDGLSGEKGLAGYASYALTGVATLLGHFARMDPNFVPELVKRQPVVKDMFRFHIDAWCLGQYYPEAGDSGSFSVRQGKYPSVSFSPNPGMEPSMYAFLYDLFRATGEAAFAQLIYRTNGKSVKGLPYDLFARDPAGVQKTVQGVVSRFGDSIRPHSINKTRWGLAVLHSGQGADSRSMWLDYDSGGQHAHADGMNLGLYGLGLDLMPDFGYPPVQYGGWTSPQATWYKTTAAHNTVVVDGVDLKEGQGKSTLWGPGKSVHLIRASGPELIGSQQYERTAMLVDVSPSACYVVDLFRVVGGHEHVKYFRSTFGSIRSSNLGRAPASLALAPNYLMRNLVGGTGGPWTLDLALEDRYKYLSPGTPANLRVTDLTEGAEAYQGESWVSVGGFNANQEAWIPTLAVRRQGNETYLTSVFLSLIEPYATEPVVREAHRVEVRTPEGGAYPRQVVGLEVGLTDGTRDLFLSGDFENPLGLQPSFQVVGSMLTADVRVDGHVAFVRRDASGRVLRMALGRGTLLRAGAVELKVKPGTEFVEVDLSGAEPEVVAGPHGAVESLKVGTDIYRP